MSQSSNPLCQKINQNSSRWYCYIKIWKTRHQNFWHLISMYSMYTQVLNIFTWTPNPFQFCITNWVHWSILYIPAGNLVPIQYHCASETFVTKKCMLIILYKLLWCCWLLFRLGTVSINTMEIATVANSPFMVGCRNALPSDT